MKIIKWLGLITLLAGTVFAANFPPTAPQSSTYILSNDLGTAFDSEADFDALFGGITTSNFVSATIQEFTTADTTPDVSAAATKVDNMYYTNANGTITDFDDGDDHSEFVNGESFFILRVDDASTVIDFSANANIEGNGGQDSTGSATQITYWIFLYEDDRWNAVSSLAPMSNPTTLAMASVEVLTLELDELNDTTGDRLLTVTELKGTILSNGDAVGATEYDFPARTEGWNFIFKVEAVQNVVFDPNGTETWYLNGTQMAAGEAIVNEAPTVGETITCISTERGVYCDSKDSDWAEDTP